MWKLFIVPAFALIAGLWGLPSYSLYQLLRVVVALQAAAFALIFFNEERIWDKALSLFFLAMVITFFPIFDIHFSRQDWRIIDIIAALSLIAGNLLIIKYDNQKDASKTEKFQQTIQNLNAENNKLKKENENHKLSLKLLNQKLNEQNEQINNNNNFNYEELEKEYKNLQLQKSRIEHQLNFSVRHNKEANKILISQKINNILSADVEIINTNILNAFLTHKSVVVRYDVVKDVFLLELFKTATPILNGYDGYFDTSIVIFATTSSQLLLSKEYLESNIEPYKKSLCHIVLRNLNKIILNILSEYTMSNSYTTNVAILKHDF